MYRSSHTSINDAVIVLSPDPIRKTVGNFLKSTQTTEYLSNLKKETNLPRCSPWFANYVKVFPIVEKFSKLSTNPQISPYNPYYRNENTLPKTGDGVVQHGQVTQSYDDNGNLTSDGSYTYSWDYRNRLTDSTANDNISHYLYDHDNRRVQMEVDEGEGTTTTKYWNKYYSTKGNVLTRYIFAGDTLLATIEGEGTATSTYCNHPDHLGGANVTTDESGNLSELDTYYPFGAIRQNEKEGSFDQKRKAIGQYYDEATALNYYNARYMSGAQGRFLSQDPSFLEVGNIQQIEKLTGNSFANYLSNPQNLNSYSYAINNPIRFKDEKGNYYHIAIGAGLGFIGGIAGEYTSDVINNINQQGGFSARTLVPEGGFAETMKRYGKAGGEGLAVGATVAANPFLGAGLQGLLTGAESYKNDGKVSVPQFVVSTGITLGTAGIGKSVAQVSGRLPNVGTRAFFTGAHTQQQGILEGIQLSLNALSIAIANITNTIKEVAPVTGNKQKKN